MTNTEILDHALGRLAFGLAALQVVIDQGVEDRAAQDILEKAARALHEVPPIVIAAKVQFP